MLLFLLLKRLDGFARVLRAAAVVAILSLLLTMVLARRARADLAATSTRIGRDLAPLADVLGGATTIALNGQKMMLRYDGSPKKVVEILDAAEQACRAGEVKAPRVDPESVPLADRALRLADLGVVRGGNDDEGAVLCFARGADTPDSLLAQLDRLTQTNDLGSLGKMRYVYAKKERGGSAVLAAVTDDSFRLDALRPAADRDAPGSDDPLLPRPLGSVRLFSGVLEGTPYASRVYRTRAADADVKEAFEKEMLERGFEAISVTTKDGKSSTGFQRDGVMVIFGTVTDRDGSVLVSVGTIGVDARTKARVRTSSG